MVKTITVTEEAYDKLRAIKKEDESFSELFVRITEEKKGIIGEFFGILGKSEGDMAAERKRWSEARKRLSRELEMSLHARP